jgi:putative nucleotidyltransferase with HDIG domain
MVRATAHYHLARVLILTVSALLLSTAHFALGTGTHRLHVIHVVFEGLYLIPIIAGAIWYGARGGVACAVGISALFYLHIRLSWPGQAMENVNQFAMIVIYLLLGSLSGFLVDAEAKERTRRLEAERLAEREAILQGIATLSNALRFRDEYTEMHSKNVARLAVEIGRQRGLTGERLELLRLAGLMHDVGKIGIRDDVLFKPDELSAEERDAMHRHPILAAEIIQPIHGSGEIAKIVLAHHECPDGSGYPGGLHREEIPLESLILSVADVYSALTDERPYKSALSQEQALAIMTSMAGKLDEESLRGLKEILEKPSL